MSGEPQATQEDYGLETGMIGANETFQGEHGQPVRGAVRLGSARRGAAAGEARRLRGAIEGEAEGEHEVITLCLDQHHWFFAHGIRVHNKGCFVPSTRVTLADGTRKAIGSVVEGEVVRSWDEAGQKATNATVMSVARYESADLMDVFLGEGKTRLTSTHDHPYWSHGQGPLYCML